MFAIPRKLSRPSVFRARVYKIIFPISRTTSKFGQVINFSQLSLYYFEEFTDKTGSTFFLIKNGEW